MLLLFIFSLVAYLLGSLSSAIIVSQCAGLADPRTQGSGNPGASNILRIGGKKLAGIVLLGDLLKGWIPVMLAKLVGLPLASLAWVAFFAFIGHLYPVFFSFRGGKGVATALGGLLALAWPVGLIGVLSWGLALFLFRYISIASMLAAVVTFFYVFYVYSFPVYLPIFLMTVLLIARHFSNIQRLFQGTEPRLTKTKLNQKK
ncbi:glycerol-3-phosphate 1-O-acyltransferase PlsY [Rickettsiella endosymbiont of Litargus connexus]|jgi:glycerol-3-phosphate acyltransferase PlsY|uniref:glycerol-3-phosphate 1-O-acyltransferase PlsY n=1 Tax=Rickettsiella endosymbiont of Litargus connexus TaxID=3066237 RepID=UPI0027E61270|nr:glycerol-3-phosphate 1-O-acyltransferase PlsY [Gammaproteobacteria bacterium]MCH9754244.1 glycerol-3-phosphate 1-O-acyltransferase PlsY [Gammaproteobacteria bacterium]MDD4893143.1 glycerol-3-phosphate 1-O-acyltransferase PlsY [Candidatus Rickettsiella isopodorum]MDD5161995.1 glycerol-3-phosphate 1-O-acyltransferase PlsY [Candidatus Rickettsiella isopodorum]MDQ5899859.1 Glycerol-3-phosphate acyltransferase [Pseudomonadota bacterium]